MNFLCTSCYCTTGLPLIAACFWINMMQNMTVLFLFKSKIYTYLEIIFWIILFSLIQKTFQKEENGLDAQLDFEEFVHYLQDYEKDLKFVVKSINKKNAGVCFTAGVSDACLVSVSLCQLHCWTVALNMSLSAFKGVSTLGSSCSLSVTLVFTFLDSMQKRPLKGSCSVFH